MHVYRGERVTYMTERTEAKKCKRKVGRNGGRKKEHKETVATQGRVAFRKLKSFAVNDSYVVEGGHLGGGE